MEVQHDRELGRRVDASTLRHLRPGLVVYERTQHILILLLNHVSTGMAGTTTSYAFVRRVLSWYLYDEFDAIAPQMAFIDEQSVAGRVEYFAVPIEISAQDFSPFNQLRLLLMPDAICHGRRPSRFVESVRNALMLSLIHI